MEPNATVTGGDGEMDGQSVRLTEASFNAFAASCKQIFYAFYVVAFSFLRFRFSHVYAPVGRIESRKQSFGGSTDGVFWVDIDDIKDHRRRPFS